ncbi:MAG: Peptidase family M50 [archaeon ADurb.Bin336]|nr:MAG: Peptidase family M50 [archaeon ADurb.Bin336]
MAYSKKNIFYFSPQEKKDLIISWLTLSLAFAIMINPVFFNITNLLISFPIALVAVGTGFILHELAHRETAKYYGFHSEFRAWYQGLFIALALAIITGGRFLFAAPGATYFFAEKVTPKQNGIISLAGPVINLVVGLLLMMIASLFKGDFLQIVFALAGRVNFFFAFFNLLPILMLDGSKVFAWNKLIWAFFFLLSAVLVFMPELFF